MTGGGEADTIGRMKVDIRPEVAAFFASAAPVSPHVIRVTACSEQAADVCRTCALGKSSACDTVVWTMGPTAQAVVPRGEEAPTTLSQSSCFIVTP